MPRAMPEFLTLAHFTPLVGSDFRLPDVPGVSLVLSHAQNLSRMKKGGVVPGLPTREPFDLIFVGPMSPVLPQQMHRLEAQGAEPMEIFIVPIGPVEGGMGYQAIFT